MFQFKLLFYLSKTGLNQTAAVLLTSLDYANNLVLGAQQVEQILELGQHKLWFPSCFLKFQKYCNSPGYWLKNFVFGFTNNQLFHCVFQFEVPPICEAKPYRQV